MSSAATPLHAVAFNCTLKGSRGKEKSSTEVLLQQLLEALEGHGVTSEIIRAVDHNILPGVEHDEGRGDDWPKLLKRLLAADIVILGTPIWLGQSCSVAKRVLERMDAFIYDLDGKGRMKSFGKVALVAVVGNEDGAASCLGRDVPGAQRLRLFAAGVRHDLLGRRGDEQERLQAIVEDAEGGRQRDGDGRGQRGASRHAAAAGSVSRERMTPRQAWPPPPRMLSPGLPSPSINSPGV